LLGIAAVLVTGGVVAYALTAPAVRSTSDPRAVDHGRFVVQLAEWRVALNAARDPYYDLINKILDVPRAKTATAQAAMNAGRDAQRYALAGIRPLRRGKWMPRGLVDWKSARKLEQVQNRCITISAAVRDALSTLRSAPMGVTAWWTAEAKRLEPKLLRLANAVEAVQATCEARLQELEGAALAAERRP
jgi:hypothetical protein